ncbi:MAG: tyrosine-type recombinase/integrase [Chloroflexota bacterium]|nr:tyrosine-type recombinase/integrase [Chloroflexota bacterium]
MFQLQKVVLPSTGRATWTVVALDFSLLEPVDAFLSYLDAIDRSPNTVRAYALGLARYFTFLEERGVAWGDVGLDDVAAFVVWLRAPAANVVALDSSAARLSDSTVNLYLTAVSQFYDYEVRHGCEVAERLARWRHIAGRRYRGFLGHITPRQPLRRGRAVRLPQPTQPPATLTAAQIQAILLACSHKRDLFVFSLLWETGLRIGEALGLRHEDMHTWDLRVRVVPRDDNANGARAKSGARDVHISKELARLYSDYMHEEYGLLDSDYVFVNLWSEPRGAPMTYTAVAQLVARLRVKTGVDFRPHLFRHTHATELRQVGVVSDVIRRRLGHSSVATTDSMYTHLDTDFVRSQLEPFWQSRERARVTP